MTELIDASVEMLKKQLKTLNSMVRTHIEELSKDNPSIQIIASVPGVGPVTTAMLCCELPELGKISRGQIAKLVGVAPRPSSPVKWMVNEERGEGV